MLMELATRYYPRAIGKRYAESEGLDGNKLLTRQRLMRQREQCLLFLNLKCNTVVADKRHVYTPLQKSIIFKRASRFRVKSRLRRPPAIKVNL
jgi:hypothetical protein